MGELSPWHWAIVIGIAMVLFGAKRLPDAARSLGRSARILKAETKGLREDPAPRDLEAKAEAEYRREATPPPAAAPAPAPAPAPPPAAEAPQRPMHVPPPSETR